MASENDDLILPADFGAAKLPIPPIEFSDEQKQIFRLQSEVAELREKLAGQKALSRGLDIVGDKLRAENERLRAKDRAERRTKTPIKR
jgi:hypothetical protein